MSRRALALVAAVALIVLGAPVVFGATGDTQAIDRFDDFEDGDTVIERPHISGWDDPEGVFGSTTNEITGSFSGSYKPDSDKTNQPVSATRSHLSTDWANFSSSMDGENGEALVHEMKLKSQGSLLLELRYQENSTDNYGNLTVQDDNGLTKIGEWKESATGVQDWDIDFDFGSDTAEVYLNSTSQGTFDLQAQADGWDEIELETVTFQLTSDDSELRIDDIGESFTATDPSVKNATAEPTGTLDSATPTLEINVSDPDFGDPEGDEVTIKWFKDGNQFATDTVASNGTVSQQTTFSGGDHNWSINATDAYDGSTVSKTFDVKAPGNITLREESEPHDIIKNAQVSIGIFGSNETLDKRSVNDGNVSLGGLAVDETYIVTVDADGYAQRSAIITDLFEQTSVFVPNESKSTVTETRFSINDRTGEFPDPTLIIEKSINRSIYDGSAPTRYEYVEVAGDRIGATDFTASLIQNDRYRLIVKNTEGDTRVLGSYTAENNRSVELTIETAGINQTQATAAISYNVTRDNGEIVAIYNDSEQQTQPLRVIIYEKNNRSNEIENSSFSGPFGDFRLTKPLTASQQNKSWVVEFRAERGSETETITIPLGAGQDELIPGVPFPFVEIAAVGLIVTTPALLGGDRAETGAVVATVLAALMWYVDALPDTVNIATVAFAMLVAVLFKLRARGGRQVQ